MPHNIRLSDETFDAYQDLADAVGLPSVTAAIVFTAKQALPALKSRFTPDTGLLQQRQNAPAMPRGVSAFPQSAASCGGIPQPATEEPQDVASIPQTAGAKALKFLMED